MITYRNNIRSLESDTLAKEMLFWLVQVLQDHVATYLTTNIRVETVSCSFADLPAHFPSPTEYLTNYKQSKKQISQWIETNVVDATVSPVFRNPAAVKAINAIREVQIIILSEGYKRDITDDAYFASNHILPIFYDLLEMLNHERSMLQEAFRLAAMVFVHELQAMVWGRIPPLLFIEKLYRVLSSSEIDWSSEDPTLFWIIAVALTSDMASLEHRALFNLKFKLLLKANKIERSESFMRRVAHISWNCDVLKMRTEVLRGCLKEHCM